MTPTDIYDIHSTAVYFSHDFLKTSPVSTMGFPLPAAVMSTSKIAFQNLLLAQYPMPYLPITSVGGALSRAEGARDVRGGILLARNRAYRLRDLRPAGGGSENVGVWLWLFAVEPRV